MGAKRVSKQGVTVSEGNAIEVTNTAGTALFSVNSTGNINTLANLTAKGSILTASAANTPATLAVGANGETLVADSSTSTGLRWQANQAAGKNALINGAFDIWQRGTTSTSTGYQTADRWTQTRGAATASWSQVTSSLPTGFRYAMKVQRTAGQTSTDGISINQVLETANSIPFAGQTVTLSFYAKAGANFSATNSKIPIRLYTGTGTDQASGSYGTWTGYAEPIAQDVTITTSWARYSLTGSIASSATQIGLVFYLNGTGTAGADDSFQITGVQLELGSVATAFTRTGGTLAGELAACQRYYWAVNNPGANGGINQIANGFYSTSSQAEGVIQFPVPMRVAPTLATVSVTNGYTTQRAASAMDTFSAFTGQYGTTTNAALIYISGLSSKTIGQALTFGYNNNATALMSWSAEL